MFSHLNDEGEELNNSRDINTIIGSKSFGGLNSKFVNHIYRLIGNVGLFEFVYMNKKNKYVEYLDYLLVELYTIYNDDPVRFLSVSKNNNNYVKKNDLPLRYKYNINDSKSRVIIEICDALEHIGLIYSYKGVYYKVVRRNTRIRATEQLTTLFKEFELDKCQIINIKRGEKEVLILKDQNKKLIDYPETMDTIRERDNIIKYNKLLDITNITLSTSVNIYNNNNNPIFFDSKTVYRIFNNNGCGGGRYYGPWWQKVGKSNRCNILVNGNPTVEIDFKAIHPTLCYLKNGIDINLTGFNPYITDDKKSGKNIYKIMLLCLINAISKKKALGAAVYKIKMESFDFPDDYPDNINKLKMSDFALLLEQLINHNKPISNFVFSGYGSNLMLEDSYITSILINYFTSKNIPILTIHDSYVIEESYKDDLVMKMKEAFNENLKTFNYAIKYSDPIVS